jgi:hypothetical protein
MLFSKKTLFLYVLLLILAITLTAWVTAASAHYSTKSQAISQANAYAASECGFAWNWVCTDTQYLGGASCTTWGLHEWKCENVVEEQSFDLRLRRCWITTRWNWSTNTYHYNTCRH